MTKSRSLPVTGLVGLALSLCSVGATANYSILVNGQPLTRSAVVLNGEPYVPLSALKLLGITGTVKGNSLFLTLKGTAAGTASPAGGAYQIAALEGCVNETLFNGIWRMKVVSVSPIRTPDAGRPDLPGWVVQLEMRNGAAKTTSLMDTGFGASSGGSQPALVLADGTTLTLDDNDFLKPWSKAVLQGGVLAFPLRFSYPVGTTDAQARTQQPSKFILQIKGQLPDYLGIKYSVPDPSLRVRLDCRK